MAPVIPETEIDTGPLRLNYIISQIIDFIADKDMASPEEACLEMLMAEEAQRILATLSPREEKILRKRFGIGEIRPYTLKEVGVEFGLTRERFRQIEEKALQKLRKFRISKSLDLLEK